MVGVTSEWSKMPYVWECMPDTFLLMIKSRKKMTYSENADCPFVKVPADKTYS